MYEFIEYVLWELKNSFALVLLAGIGAAAVLAVTYILHRKRHGGARKFPWGKALLWLMFIGYMAIVVYATMLRGFGFFRREWNLHLFRAWREAWNNYSVKNWANVLLNVAMFVPLGFLLPLLGKGFRKWYVAVPSGFGVSLAIELLQLAIGIGICDVDDLFANTLGALMGYLLIMTVLSLFREKGGRLRPGLAYGGLFAASLLAVCSIFIVYEVKEYGNLPEAAAYSADMGGIEWDLQCELPDCGGEAATYQSQPRSIAECDAFAENFAETVGTVFDDISYYQEAAYYMDHGGDDGWHHFLFVHYHDSGYEYSCGNLDDSVWTDADRESLEAALHKYPLTVPEYAEFAVEGDGWHSFTVKQHVDGAVMTDGTLRCRYAQDGTVREIENDLLAYAYYGTVGIITAEEAYRQLRGGNFLGADTVKKYASGAVTVVSCSLDYAIDTKGFYQPVYTFALLIPKNGYTYQIMIPAME